MNKVILCGRLTAKPELRYTGSNKPYARFTLAVNRPRIKDKEQEVDFINCIAWRNTAEFVNKYLHGLPDYFNELTHHEVDLFGRDIPMGYIHTAILFIVLILKFVFSYY